VFVCTKVLFATPALTFLSFMATRTLPGMTKHLRHATPFLFLLLQHFTLTGDLKFVQWWLVGRHHQATLRLGEGVTSVV
jgi:hypothetical protein